jgi:hypothetical protein
MPDWRQLPPTAKLLVILVIANTLMLAYDTDIVYHLEQLTKGL